VGTEEILGLAAEATEVSEETFFFGVATVMICNTKQQKFFPSLAC
jgi:hypothetical protein